MREDHSNVLVGLKENGTDLPKDAWADVTTTHFRNILAEPAPLSDDLDATIYGWHSNAPRITPDQVADTLEKTSCDKSMGEDGTGINMWIAADSR